MAGNMRPAATVCRNYAHYTSLSAFYTLVILRPGGYRLQIVDSLFRLGNHIYLLNIVSTLLVSLMDTVYSW